MKRSRFTEEQIIGILKEHQAGLGAKELCRKHGVSDATFDLRPEFPPVFGRVLGFQSDLMRPVFP